MSTILNASTSSGLVQTADTSGTLELQSNGTTQLTVASTGVYGTLKSGTTVASTSGTSIDFTGIPSWVKRITVMLSGVSTSGTSNLLVQLGDSGGIEATGYLGAGTRFNAGAATTVSFTTGAGVPSDLASATNSGSFVIQTIGSNAWTITGNVGGSNTAMYVTGSGKTLSDTLDRIRITTVNGTDTFDAGSINIIYEG